MVQSSNYSLNQNPIITRILSSPDSVLHAKRSWQGQFLGISPSLVLRYSRWVGNTVVPADPKSDQRENEGPFEERRENSKWTPPVHVLMIATTDRWFEVASDSGQTPCHGFQAKRTDFGTDHSGSFHHPGCLTPKSALIPVASGSHPPPSLNSSPFSILISFVILSSLASIYPTLYIYVFPRVMRCMR